MNESKKLNRRAAIATIAGATGAAALLAAGAEGKENPMSTPTGNKGRLKQSVCKWCYPNVSLDDLCREGAKMGIQAIDLLGEGDWATVKKHGLTCAVANGPGGISEGWNRVEKHDELVRKSEEMLPKIAEAKLPNMIVFSGDRREGLTDEEGLENCAKGLKRITPLAEKLGVTVIMELLNSKVDNKGYQCDRTPWGVALCKRVESDRFKLLYDIYHMQIMEGDVIRTIRDNIAYIGHFHTGGVPGRNEIDETQELHYQTIAKAIADTNYAGYFAHEFIPKREDKLASLAQAVKICTV